MLLGGTHGVPWHSPNWSVLIGSAASPVDPRNTLPQNNPEQVLPLHWRLFCTTVNSEMLREDKQVCSEGTSPKAPGNQARSIQPVPGPGTNPHPRTMTGRGISQLQQVNSHATVKRHRSANYFTPSLPEKPAGMRSDSCQSTWPPPPLTSTTPTALPAERAGRTEPRIGFQGKNGNLTLFSRTHCSRARRNRHRRVRTAAKERLCGHTAQMEPESLCSPQQSPWVSPW